MIAYFDSSSIVKWFFDEIDSDLARNTKDHADFSATSEIAYPEVMSAIHRAYREGCTTKEDMVQARDEMERIWPDFILIKISEKIIKQAGQLIFKHGLRGFDSIHMSSAMSLRQNNTTDIDIIFSCFDNRLNQAAQAEEFECRSRKPIRR
ncbi:MAG: type II toxin-antitoxin system VapC family toxin [Deltaproteobacteria bacterium]|nr:type II toxin-antitoxin system VapC family toxin [Deltaproteobacteria bacterium]